MYENIKLLILYVYFLYIESYYGGKLSDDIELRNFKAFPRIRVCFISLFCSFWSFWNTCTYSTCLIKNHYLQLENSSFVMNFEHYCFPFLVTEVCALRWRYHQLRCQMYSYWLSGEPFLIASTLSIQYCD